MNVWLKELLKSLDENLDEKTRIVIMEACGEATLLEEEIFD